MLTTLVAATVLSATATFWTASQAIANDGDCGSGDLCLWQDPAWSGGNWDDSGLVGNYASGHRWWGTQTSINDQASSLRCRYNFKICQVYEHSYWRGGNLQVLSGGEIHDLADYGMSDKLSSNYF